MNATHALIALPQATDITLCGAKAATLARLARAHLPIPQSIVIPATWPTGRLAALIPDLLLWAKAHAAPALIARSSAPAEDGTHASFAGLYASAFTPATPDDLLNALRQVRRSAHTSTTRDYARLAGTQNATAIAILLQPALRPYAAGIAAIDNLPTRPTGHVQAVWGLAEPLANGRHTGELHTLGHDGTTLALPGDQEDIVLPCNASELRIRPGEWITITTPDQASTRLKVHLSQRNLLRLHTPTTWARPILTPERVQDVATLALAAAAELGLDRIDVEWALTPDQRLHLLQARPLTTPLPPGPHTSPAPSASAGWHGIPAVAGIGSGPALHLTHSTMPGLTADDTRASVIICHTLGPEAVHVLLARPRAIVAAHGGPLCHTAILARELGIPCVTAITDAMTTIPPGQHLHVNGSTGTITPIPPPTSTPPPHTPCPTTTLADTAILTRDLPTAAPPDDRAATILLHTSPDPPTSLTAARFAAARHTHPAPLGILQYAPTPLLPAIPGCDLIHIDRLGQLIWPKGTPLPAHIAVLAPDTTILYQRPITPPA